MKKLLAMTTALCLCTTGLYLPNNSDSVLSSISASAETSAEDYEFNAETGTITKYLGSDEIVEIPSEIEGFAVTGIGDYTFDNCKSLTSITIPDSVTSIGFKAFYYCTSLESIILSDSVTSIGDYAFTGCSKLTNITLPDSVTNIGDRAFSGCYKFTSIILPDSVASIGNYAFEYCSNLTNVTIPDSVKELGRNAFADTPWFTKEIETSKSIIIYSGYCGEKVRYELNIDGILTISGTGATYDNDNSERYRFFNNSKDIKKVVIEDGVTRIGNFIFHNCLSLESITIPDSVTSIGEYAFSGCSSLESIILNNNSKISNISLNAFSRTKWLENKRNDNSFVILNGVLIESENCEGDIVIPDSVTSIGDYAFRGCTNLTSITIPDSVTSIGDYAFRGCSKLTSITIPDSVTSIGNYAFRECTRLSSITIPDSVSSIGWCAFSYTPWIEEMQKANPLVVVNGILIDGLTCNGTVVIPDSVKSIGDLTFYNCKNLTSITIPDSVTSIGSFAFSQCTNLTSITIPDSVTSIGGNAFKGTPWLKEKQKENPLVIVNNILIDGYSSEGDVVIPDYVISIGDYAFKGVTRLTSITIPDSVVKIGNHAFINCGIKIVTIPESVTHIGNYALGFSVNWSDDYSRNYSFIIKGYPGSDAETYAKEVGLKFVALENENITTIITTTTSTTTTTTTTTPITTVTYSYGDVTGDGVIDATDASFVLTAYAKSSINEDDGMTEEQKKFADVNKDGVVDAVDASAVLTFYALSSTGNKQTFDEFIKSLNN